MKETVSGSSERIYRIVLDVFFVLLFCVYPLYSKLTYFGIIDTKYAFLRLIFYIGFPVLCVFRIFLDHHVRWKNLIPLILWGFAVLLAWAQSIEPSIRWSGYPAWYLGTESQLMFIGIAFLFTDFRDWKLFDLALIVFVVEAVLIILNRFDIYFFDMNCNLGDQYAGLFLGTLGNIDWIAGWYALFLPMMFLRFMHARKFLVVWFAFCILVSIGAVCDGSDALVLCLFLVVLLLSIDALRTGCIGRYGYLAAGVFLGLFVFGFFSDDLALGDILQRIVHSPLLVAVGCFGLLLGWKGWAWMSWKKWMLVIVTVLLAGVMGFIVLNVIHPSWLPMDSLLTFNNNWGNHRGFLWLATVRGWRYLLVNRPLKALFGVGPDQYYYLMNDLYLNGNAAYFHSVAVTNAHCEILNNLINYGIFGFAVYIYLLVSSMVRGFRSGNEGGVMLAYCVLSISIVNIFMFQEILSTPLEFALIGSLLVMKTAEKEGKEVVSLD